MDAQTGVSFPEDRGACRGRSPARLGSDPSARRTAARWTQGPPRSLASATTYLHRRQLATIAFRWWRRRRLDFARCRGQFARLGGLQPPRQGQRRRPMPWHRFGLDRMRKPVARVLESRILPPYEGSSGLGTRNTPGLPRLREPLSPASSLWRESISATPICRQGALEAFTPFIPLDRRRLGLPVAVLRYTGFQSRIRNGARGP